MSRYLLCLALIVGYERIATARDEAELVLAEYLMAYEDKYEEFVLRYRGDVWSKRPNSEVPDARERIRFFEGIVASSKKRKLEYGGRKESDGISTNRVMEELFVNGRQYKKNYGLVSGRTAGFLKADEFKENGEQVSIVPFVHPHGLVLMRDTEFVGKNSDIKRAINLYQKSRVFVESTELSDGTIRGVWRSPLPGMLFTTIDFSKEEHLPIRTAFWISNGEDKISKGERICETSAKWKAIDKESYYPSEIRLSGFLGVNKTEMALEFEFVSPLVLSERMSKIDLGTFPQKLGSRWFDEFDDWFTARPIIAK